MAHTGKYLELAETLARKIGQEFSPGDQFPTVADLAALFHVAPNTVSRAVQVLKDRGLLSGKAGGKTWVRVPPQRTVRRNTRYQIEKDLALKSEDERRRTGVSELDTGLAVTSMHSDRLEIDVVKCSSDIAEALELSPGDRVLRRVGFRHPFRRSGAISGVSYISYDLAILNPDLFDPENNPWPGGSQHQLYTLGVEVGRIEDHVTASMPTDEEIRLHDIPASVPIIRVRKITFSTLGKPVEVNDIPMPADRTKLIFDTPLKSWHPSDQ